MRRRFLLRSLAFSMPFLLLLGPPLLLLERAGELTSVDQVVAMQRKRELLYGQAYSYPVKPYKLRATRQVDPEVLLVGSSRVMELRPAFFRSPEAVYNAGGAVSNAWDARRFLDLAAPSRTRLIVLGLDQWFFNPRWAEFADTGDGPFLIDDPVFNIIQRRWWTVYRDLVRGRIDVRRVLAAPSDRVGLSAIDHDTGFRSDGSYYYGEAVLHPDSPDLWDVGFRDTLGRIAAGDRRFEWSPHLAPEAVAEIAKLLDQCQSRHVRVVGFLPPFAPTVLARMRADGDHYRYLQEIAPALQAVFAAHGYAFFDFTSLDASTDSEFIDGFHGSERVDLQMLLAMALGEPELERRIDRHALAARLAHAGRFEPAPASPAQ